MKICVCSHKEAEHATSGACYGDGGKCECMEFREKPVEQLELPATE